MHRRLGQEAKDVISDREAADVRADLLDRACEIAPGNSRKLVLHHSPQHPTRDENIDPVHR